MGPFGQFDEVHIVSDLHMGGRSGFQIFNLGQPLARLIDHLRDQSPNKEVALVVNGDMVDFLAEENAEYFARERAKSMLDRIIADQAFNPVWQSLKKFVGKARRHLVVNLGNHDLELALPWVREHLLDVLSGGHDRARGRIALVLNGTGCLFDVGGASVLCVHGNEVDPWNITDYEALRRQGQTANFGLPVAEWTPNAGTKLVIDVMNDIKRRFPFVDLLKPEQEAVLPTLYALDSSLTSKLGGVMKVATKLAWDRVRIATGFLSGDDQGEAELIQELDYVSAMDQLFHQTFEAPRATSSSVLLSEIEVEFEKGTDPMAMVAEVESAQLGLFGSFTNWFRGKPQHEVLRAALDKVAHDTSFELKTKDNTFQRLDEAVGSKIDFVIAGHTHQERALRRASGGGYYYNSGTWVRLIQLTPEVLESESRFKKYHKAFQAGTMEALDKEPGMVLHKPAVVSIQSTSAGVVGEIHRVSTKSTEPLLAPVEGSKFVRN